jgi:hypothetical protein
MISSCCLSCCLFVCVSALITLEQTGNFYKIEQGGHGIEGNLEAVIFNPVALTFLKWRAFRLMMWMLNLHQSADY